MYLLLLGDSVRYLNTARTNGSSTYCENIVDDICTLLFIRIDDILFIYKHCSTSRHKFSVEQV